MRGSLLGIVRRGWWLIAVCMLVGAASAGAISATQQKQYEATAKLLFRDDSAPDQALQSVLGLPTSSPSPDPTQQAATNIALVSLDTVSNLTAHALGRHLSGGQVQGEIAVSEVGQSNVVAITATDPNPLRAATIANTFAHEFVLFRQNASKSVINAGIRGLQNQRRSLPPNLRSGPSGRALTNQIQELSALAQVLVGDAEVVQSASVPQSPSSPRTKLNIGAGAVLGLILGVGLAIVLYRFDRRLRTPGELSEEYRLPVLGVVPRTRELDRESRAYKKQMNGANVLPAAAAEAFRTIRARLRYLNRGRDLRCLLVTSAVPGEGKSTIAWELARVTTMHAEGRVLLVETDLRQPVFARGHGLRGDPGLAELLARGLPIEIGVQKVVAVNLDEQNGNQLDATFHRHPGSGNGEIELETQGAQRGRLRYRRQARVPGQTETLYATEEADRELDQESDPNAAIADGFPEAAPTMDVIVAGAVPPNPSDLLDSRAMSEFLRAAAERYEYVILDGPPAVIVSEWLPLVTRVSGIIVVTSIRNASADDAEWLRTEFEQVDAPVLGMVVNNAKHPNKDAHSKYRRRNTTARHVGHSDYKEGSERSYNADGSVAITATLPNGEVGNRAARA